MGRCVATPQYFQSKCSEFLASNIFQKISEKARSLFKNSARKVIWHPKSQKPNGSSAGLRKSSQTPPAPSHGSGGEPSGEPGAGSNGALAKQKEGKIQEKTKEKKGLLVGSDFFFDGEEKSKQASWFEVGRLKKHIFPLCRRVQSDLFNPIP